MRVLHSFLLVWLWCSQASAYAVFAHFMIGNVPDWTQANWEADITVAKAASIDAFVLNMVDTDLNLAQSISRAFAAANKIGGFKLFFSFDYGDNLMPRWTTPANVTALINQYKSNAAYYKYSNKPLVSTFEGHRRAADWKTIKSATGCFFIPSFSSQGPAQAMGLGVADGLFSWAAWPWGNTNMDTYLDDTYSANLKGKPYMMAVSPWFYTNMPGYDKNWLWRGDDLWFDRWRDVTVKRPEFVQILSWNDWGESHYIGPLRAGTYGAFGANAGNAPYNYANGMPHDGWRLFLPYLIELYKTGTSKVSKEGLVIWYRKHPKSACTEGNTTANAAVQLQIEMKPIDVIQDRIFYAALLGSTKDVTVDVKLGSSLIKGTFTLGPAGGIGVHYGSVATGGATGAVTVTMRRAGTARASVTGGPAITTTCTNNIQNYNAWVGQDVGRTVTTVSPALNLNQQVCILGTGPSAGNLKYICAMTCSYGFCPAQCHCQKLGPQKTKPKTTGKKGYPTKDLNGGEAYAGMCSFACNLDTTWCANSLCGTTKYPYVPLSGLSPWLPPSCQEGKALKSPLSGLCSFTCNYGYCPLRLCSCTKRGALISNPNYNLANPACTAGTNVLTNRDNANICKFAGERKYCPASADACQLASARKRDEDTIPEVFQNPQSPHHRRAQLKHQHHRAHKEHL